MTYEHRQLKNIPQKSPERLDWEHAKRQATIDAGKKRMKELTIFGRNKSKDFIPDPRYHINKRRES